MPFGPLHWYVALVIVLGLGGVFIRYAARDARREWLRSGRTAAEYDERLRHNRRQSLPLVVLGTVLLMLVRLDVFPVHAARYLPLVLIFVFAPFWLYELWKDRARMTQESGWRVKAVWHAVLLLVLTGLTWFVIPFLLSLP